MKVIAIILSLFFLQITSCGYANKQMDVESPVLSAEGTESSSQKEGEGSRKDIKSLTNAGANQQTVEGSSSAGAVPNVVSNNDGTKESGKSCVVGFKWEKEKCARICPKGKVYDGKSCKSCEQNLGKILWLSEDFLDIYTETPLDKNVCANDDGCTLSEKAISKKDGEIECKVIAKDSSFCNGLAKKIKAKAKWSSVDMLKDFKVGSCDGVKLTQLANEYKKNFDNEIELAIKSCREQETYKAQVFVPPYMNLQEILTKNCKSKDAAEMREELREIFLDVRSVPIYSGTID